MSAPTRYIEDSVRKVQVFNYLLTAMHNLTPPLPKGRGTAEGGGGIISAVFAVYLLTATHNLMPSLPKGGGTAVGGGRILPAAFAKPNGKRTAFSMPKTEHP